MGSIKAFALNTIEECITHGKGRTTSARLSVRLTTLGFPTTPEAATTLARTCGFKVTPRRFTSGAAKQKWDAMSYSISH